MRYFVSQRETRREIILLTICRARHFLHPAKATRAHEPFRLFQTRACDGIATRRGDPERQRKKEKQLRRRRRRKHRNISAFLINIRKLGKITFWAIPLSRFIVLKRVLSLEYTVARWCLLANEHLLSPHFDDRWCLL